MWVWLKIKLTAKGDFCVASVRAFFVVNFFMFIPKWYLNGQIEWLYIPNTLSETKICNLHPKARQLDFQKSPTRRRASLWRKCGSLPPRANKPLYSIVQIGGEAALGTETRDCLFQGLTNAFKEIFRLQLHEIEISCRSFSKTASKCFLSTWL